MTAPNRTAAVELLPCPFCGSSDVSPTGWSGGDGPDHGPACRNCHAMADTVGIWNTRATIATTAADQRVAEMLPDIEAAYLALRQASARSKSVRQAYYYQSVADRLRHYHDQFQALTLTPPVPKTRKEILVEDIEVQVSAAIKSARGGFTATARAELRGVFITLDLMDREGLAADDPFPPPAQGEIS